MSNRDKFTRADITQLLTASGIEHKKAAGLAMAIIRGIAGALIAGRVIELRGFGTFEARGHKARTAHNPRTLAPVKVPARWAVFFRPAGSLKRALNGKEEKQWQN